MYPTESIRLWMSYCLLIIFNIACQLCKPESDSIEVSYLEQLTCVSPNETHSSVFILIG
jgi:hypothetical protein